MKKLHLFRNQVEQNELNKWVMYLNADVDLIINWIHTLELDFSC